MNPRRIPQLSLILAFLAGPGCEPSDEGPPPVTAQTVAAASPTNGLPPPPPPYAADSNAAPSYASGEYAIGEDVDSYDDHDPSALPDFRAPLDPYGTWVDDPTNGTVWVPSPASVGQDFQPYVTAGHWTYDGDWIWVSDYPWGWAPFHYGRWVFIEGRGWAWIPGRAYRGAWVVWSVDDSYGYVGWAPAPPLFLWFGGAAIWYRGPYVGPRWVYCARHEVFAPAVGTRVVVGAAAAPIASRMRLYVPATPSVASGPPPQRLGYNAAQLPHPDAAAQSHIVRAQQFARPSTAQPLGAHAPARIVTASPSPIVPHPIAPGPVSAPPTMSPSLRSPVAPRASPIPGPAPVPHSLPMQHVAPAPHFTPAPPPAGAFHGGRAPHR
jgi:Family of unknown function (DUF6600)